MESTKGRTAKEISREMSDSGREGKRLKKNKGRYPKKEKTEVRR